MQQAGGLLTRGKHEHFETSAGWQPTVPYFEEEKEMITTTKRPSARNRYLKVTALILALAASFVTGLQPQSAADSLPDFSPEARQLKPFSDDLDRYDKIFEELSKKATITSADLVALNQLAESLKRRTSQPQQAFRSIVDKLRRANQLERLDELVLAKTTDERRRALVREGGGLRRQLETIVNDISRIGVELDADIQGLRAKLRAQSDLQLDHPEVGKGNLRAIRVGYSTPAAFFQNPVHPVRCSYWKIVSLLTPLDSQPADVLVKKQKHCRSTQTVTT
ncbi:MAG: hypothetical protein AB1631_07905 [Acidobacteriota bacterium]